MLTKDERDNNGTANRIENEIGLNRPHLFAVITQHFNIRCDIGENILYPVWDRPLYISGCLSSICVVKLYIIGAEIVSDVLTISYAQSTEVPRLGLQEDSYE